jgi:N-acetylneuraminic acid mutarotase
VPADSVTQVNAALPSGRVVVSTQAITTSLAMGDSASRTFTVTNTGTAAAHVHVAATAGPVTVQGTGAPLQRAPIGRRATNAAVPRVSGAAWTDLADFPMANPLSTMSGYDETNGMVYTLGWSFVNGIGQDAFYSYNPASGRWTQLKAPPVPVGFAAAGFVNGRFVVAGGASGNSGVSVPLPLQRAVSVVQVYNPATGDWTKAARMPAPRISAGAAVLDGDLYVVGGCTGQAGCATDYTGSSVYRYDAARNTWATLASYPTAENELSCGGVGGEVVCAGGNNGGWVVNSASTGASNTATYIYNPADGQWTRGADLPIDLWGSAYSVASNRLVLVGGVTANSTVITNQSFGYDPADGTWSALPNANHPITFSGSAACGLYAIGNDPATANSPSLVEALSGYHQCGPASDAGWLHAAPGNVVLAPGASATIRLALNAKAAAVPQPGQYDGQVITTADTPYPIAPVDVALTATPPASWGEVTGTVTGTRCDGTSVPIAGATVEIDSAAATHTLTTDAQGKYALWVDSAESPLTAIVSADGWQLASRTIQVSAGQLTHASFSLTQLDCTSGGAR